MLCSGDRRPMNSTPVEGFRQQHLYGIAPGSVSVERKGVEPLQDRRGKSYGYSLKCVHTVYYPVRKHMNELSELQSIQSRPVRSQPSQPHG